MGNLNKRAIVFTFIVVVLLSVILIAFLINLNTKVSQNKIQFTNVKVETINSFVKNLNSVYIPDALITLGKSWLMEIIIMQNKRICLKII
jgi:hypothetical protein